MAISVDARTEIISLVVGMFGAAPGASVLSELVASAEAGQTISQIAANLTNTTQFKGIYPTFLTNGEFAAKVVASLLAEATVAAKAEATAVLTTALNGGMTRATAMVEAIAFVGATAHTNAAFGTSAAAFDNKVDVAIYFSVDKALSASTLADLQAVVSGVGSTAASVTSAKAVIDGTADVGKGLSLTTGADSLIGTSGNDTFNGAESTAATWTVGDTIDGGAGVDTLNVTQTAVIVAPVGATVKNVEKANFLSGTTGTTINSTAWTGLTDLSITAPGAVTATAGSATNVVVTDATQAASAITVNGGLNVTTTGTSSVASGGTGGAVTIGAAAAAAGDVAVTQNVSSTNVTGGTDATGGVIAVTGGKSITVNQNITGASVATATVTVNAIGGAINVTGDASTTTATVNQSAAVTAVPSGTVGKHGIKDGAVTISDKNAGSTTAAGTIATATLKNYGDSTINSNALTTVNLEGTGGTVGITTNSLTTAANTALALNVNGLSYKNATAGTNAVTVDSDVKTLTITSSTAASTIANVTSSGATTVNVAGDALLTLTDNSFAAATAITVTNSAGATFGTTAIAAGTVFTGGAGKDSIILSDSFTKAINMGAGDDTVTVGGANIGTGGSVTGGDGTDTVKMTSALAAGFNDNATFNTKYTSFEVLELSDALGAVTLDLAGLNAVSKVVLGLGGANAASSILSNLATSGTVETKASSTGFVVNVANALFNATDTLNLRVNSATAATTGTITAAGVETLNIAAPDATSTGGTAVVHVINVLAAVDATTINVTGNNGLTITAATGSTKVATFDAAGVVANGTADTGALLAVTYTSLNTTTAVTMKGGSGDDVLTAAAASTKVQTITGGEGADKITGGAGNDIIDLTETTAAADTVVFLTATANGVDTITGFAAGATGADLVSVLAANTTVGTGAGVAVFGSTASASLTTGAAAFALTGASSTTSDVVEITTVLSTYGNLGLAGATSGTELLKALSSTDGAATSITATTAGDDFYMVAYQNGNAYLYQVTNDTDVVVTAAEIQLIGVFNGVAAGAFASGDFLVA